jgi:hypothetical protein
VSEWISVKDRLPDENVWVIVAANGVTQYGTAFLDCEGWNWFGGESDIAPTYEMSHWQPLPEPPKETV